MNLTGLNKDKASEKYWSNFWQNIPIPPPLDISNSSQNNYTFRNLNKFYKKLFKNTDTSGLKLIEIGCGNSVHLSYFAAQFNFNISGLDYSEYGCRRTIEILKRDEVHGEIFLGDLFNPPQELIGKFDIVCSFGVVEHFNDTSDVILHISRFLKPGGILITTIPNLTGLTGKLQKWMNKPVYDIHKVMGLDEITSCVRKAGFEIINSERLLPMSFGVTLDEIDHNKVKHLKLKKLVLKGFQVIEKIVCLIDDRIIALPRTEFFCAGMIVAARKPQQ